MLQWRAYSQWWRNFYIDNIVWELYSNPTKSGSNTESGWRDVSIYYPHLSQDILCPRSNCYDQTNCCESINCSCITTRPFVSQRIEQIRISCDTWWQWYGIRSICCYQQEDQHCEIICIYELALKSFLSENRANGCTAIREAIWLWIMASENGTLYESEYL